MVAQSIIFCIALFARLISAFVWRVTPAADALVYRDLAMSIASNGVVSIPAFMSFPTSDHPVYPFFLSVFYAVFNGSHDAVLFAQAVLGGFVCLLIFKTAAEFFNPKVAVIAAAIAAVYPVFVRVPAFLLTENLFMLLFLGSVLMLARFMRTERFHYLVISAICMGASILTRSVVLLFIPFAAIVVYWIFVRSRGLRTAVVYSGLYITLCVVCILPWSVRNYIVSGGSIIPVTDRGEWGIYLSFCPYQGKIFGIRSSDDPVIREAMTISSYDHRKKFLVDATCNFVRSNPWQVLKIEMLKILYLWSPFDWEILGNGQGRYNFGYMFIIPFCFAGLYYMVRNWISIYALFFLPIVYFQLLHVIYFALPRFRMPFEPFLIIAGSYAIRSLYEKSRNKQIFLIALGIYAAAQVSLFIFSSEVKIFFRVLCQALHVW